MNRSRYTKAKMLAFLKPRLKNAYVEEMLTFLVREWNTNKEKVAEDIRAKFKPSKIIIRSTASSEDTAHSSMAGFYVSKLDVDAGNRKQVEVAVQEVIKSYGRVKSDYRSHEVLVQAQTEDIAMSGVVFTRQMETNAPYYIINYDELTGRSDFVTSGKASQMMAVSRFVKPPFKPKWKKLLTAIQEIEAIFPGRPLDIEFAVKKNGVVVIFQVRPLAVNWKKNFVDDALVKKLIDDMKSKFLRYTKRVPHLCGQTTIYGDMPDWNPAEIIGDRPNTLDYTIYRFLITNNIWHEARTALGYCDVFPGELMTSFGRKPYIDTRLSFNSMIPAEIPKEIREKLVNYYLKKLADNPHCQDKVEFEILWTCYDFSLEKKLQELLGAGFSAEELKIIEKGLKGLTFRIIENHEEIFKKNLLDAQILNDRRANVLEDLSKNSVSVWELLNGVNYILSNCRKFGTFPFSLLARIAFISQSLILSMLENGIIDKECYDAILLSVETVAKKFTRDMNNLENGRLASAEFLTTYGHLRSGTYDITSPRYDQMSQLFKTEKKQQRQSMPRINGDLPQAQLTISPKNLQSIEKALSSAGLRLTAEQFLSFITRSLEYRELSKFEFTKSLSDSIELLVRAGKKLGLKRDELCHVDLSRLLSLRNPDVSDEAYIKKTIRSSIQRHRMEKEWYKNVMLPSLICSVGDFEYVESYQSRPNFVTSKTIEANVVYLTKDQAGKRPNLSKKIVLIESADPGYDWIFSRGISGLVTKYGGVASHMAIRCAEFGIPAAIGCGENIFRTAVSARSLLLNCEKKELMATDFQEKFIR